MNWEKMGARGFIGKYEHTIDSNGRLSIPAKFRESLTAHANGAVVMTMDLLDSCLVVYPSPVWEAIAERVAEYAEDRGERSSTGSQTGPTGFSRKQRNFSRLFCSRAVDGALDKQGRILLPPSLRTEAGLQRETVLVGLRNLFEIWNPARWQEKESHVLGNPEQLEEVMAVLGL